MSVAVIVAICLGALALGEGALIAVHATRPEPEVATVVESIVAPALAQEETTQQVLSTDRARWVCEGEHYDQVACMAVLLCAQVAGGTVQPSACDAAVNAWVSSSTWATCATDRTCLELYGRRK